MRVRRFIRRAVFATGLITGSVVMLAAPASASSIYSLPVGTPADQNWAGSLGLDFTVNSNIVVYGLGAWADGGTPIDVVIYNATTGSPVSGLSTTITSALSGVYVFNAVTPVTLTPGSYQVAAWGYGSGTGNYNTGTAGCAGGSSGSSCPALGFNTLGGELTFGSPYYNTNATGFATTLDDIWNDSGPYGIDHYYGAGNFEAFATPLPSTWTMLIAGFLGLGFLAYRGRKRDSAALTAA